MKRLLALLFLLVLVGGCAKVSNEQAVANTAPAAEQAPKVDADNTIQSLGNDLYTAKYNVADTFHGKSILVTDIDQSSALFSATVGGDKVTFHGTKEVEVVGGLEMYVDRIESVGPELADKRVIFHIIDFKQEADQYLVRKDEPITVSGHSISVGTSKIDSNLIRSIPVTVDKETDVSIKEGGTYSFKTVDVTNVKTFIFDKSYALLSIVPKAY